MSPRPVAEHEVRRILALVPWIVAHPGSHTDEIAQRFGITASQLESDLDLALMVGVPPYGPGDYLDVEIDDDGRVTIRLAEYFRRPLRMTPAEGLSLLAAARTLLAVPGTEPDGALARAVAKLAEVLRLPDVDVDVAAPAHLAEVRAAARDRSRVEIDYWSANRDEVLTRAIDPAPPFYALGAWYVPAFCHRAGEERLFRVDRIRALRATGEHFERSDDEPVIGAPPVFQPAADDPRVTLVVGPGAAWLPEVAPTESVETLPDGRLRITLVVTETAWLERLVLRLGPNAEVEAPPELRTTAARTAARVLRRYGRSESGRPVRS